MSQFNFDDLDDDEDFDILPGGLSAAAQALAASSAPKPAAVAKPVEAPAAAAAAPKPKPTVSFKEPDAMPPPETKTAVPPSPKFAKPLPTPPMHKAPSTGGLPVPSSAPAPGLRVSVGTSSSRLTADPKTPTLASPVVGPSHGRDKEEKERKEREEKERKEKEKEAKEQKEKEAKEAKEAKEKEAKDAKEAKEREAKEAKEAKEREAKEAKEREKEAKEQKEREAKEAKEKEKEKSGGFWKFGSKKRESTRAKVTIGNPMHFQHIKGVSETGNARPEGFEGMHRSESSNTLQSTDTGSFIGDDRQSLNGEPFAGSLNVPLQSIEELQAGGYFFRPGKSDGRQLYMCTSDDLSRLNMYASYYDKNDSKQVPKEFVLVSDITDVKPGGSADARAQLAFTITAGGRAYEYEAFTPEERDAWCGLFNALLSFSRGKP